MSTMLFSHNLLAATLELAVPLEIASLRSQGGPDDVDTQWAHAYAQELAEHGDVLLYAKKNKTAAQFTRLARALAIIAFCPGGVDFAGAHFEAAT